jgi:hypothetical protein
MNAYISTSPCVKLQGRRKHLKVGGGGGGGGGGGAGFEGHFSNKKGI